MVSFSDLQARLVAAVQAQVHGGRLTERGLARGCGVSQPHIHHILAGKRGLTIPVADRILDYLRISTADLVRERGHPAYSSVDAGPWPADQIREGGESGGKVGNPTGGPAEEARGEHRRTD